jgi:undecaprenyl phosphate N,N'-diacetylbacillosamine 1-phosphate transferase
MTLNYIFFKRGFDLLVLLLFLPLYLMIMLVISLFVYLEFGRPILFTQNRLGKNNKVFAIYKFRSMNNNCDEFGNLLPDNLRLSYFGRMLRKSSLDELPALINVFKGEMSIVGPRPFLAEYEMFYSREQQRRHDVLPGITGWAQINGRNNLKWSDKFKLDIFYVDNISLYLDIKILFLTVFKVFTAKDVTKDDCATTEKFNGNN